MHICICIYIYITVPYQCQRINNPPEKGTRGRTSLRSTEAEVGEQFLLQDCRAQAHVKGRKRSFKTLSFKEELSFNMLRVKGCRCFMIL